MDLKVDVQGEQAVIAAIRKAGPRFRIAGGRVVAASALAIQTDAKKRTPVDTGRLRSSIRANINQGAMQAVVGTDVEYAPHVEHGTSKMAASPFLHPAFEGERPRFLTNLAAVLKGEAEGLG